MLLHGIAKFKGLEGIESLLTDKGLPEILAYGVYVTEVVAPLLLIFGFRTRIAALIYAFGMVVATYLAHMGDIFSLTSYGGWAIELIGLHFFIAICLFLTGGGKYAVSSKSKWD